MRILLKTIIIIFIIIVLSSYIQIAKYYHTGFVINTIVTCVCGYGILSVYKYKPKQNNNDTNKANIDK